MSILSVQYDLREHGRRDYRHLEAAVKRFPAWCHALQSTWFVSTTNTPKEVYDYLRPCLGRTDSLLVVPVLMTSYWSQGLSKSVLDWLKWAYDAENAAC
jgi:hypothetical protein